MGFYRGIKRGKGLQNLKLLFPWHFSIVPQKALFLTEIQTIRKRRRKPESEMENKMEKWFE